MGVQSKAVRRSGPTMISFPPARCPPSAWAAVGSWMSYLTGTSIEGLPTFMLALYAEPRVVGIQIQPNDGECVAVIDSVCPLLGAVHREVLSVRGTVAARWIAAGPCRQRAD